MWLAGGIGITPFLSMAAGLDENTRVMMVWSVRRKQDAIYEGELSRIARDKPNLEVIVHATSELGHLEIATLHLANRLQDYSAFVCGPLPMRREFMRPLKVGGVPGSQIFFEEFRLR